MAVKAYSGNYRWETARTQCSLDVSGNARPELPAPRNAIENEWFVDKANELCLANSGLESTIEMSRENGGINKVPLTTTSSGVWINQLGTNHQSACQSVNETVFKAVVFMANNGTIPNVGMQKTFFALESQVRQLFQSK